MTRRNKFIAIIVVGLLVILAIVLVFVMQERGDDPVIDDSETAPVATIDVPEEKKEIIKKEALSEDEKMASAIKPVAIAFVERFGTFTNHSDFISIQDLSPIMTETMTSWVETVYIPQLTKSHDPKGFFYRVTATAPVVLINEETESGARVTVTAERTEKKGDSEQVTFLQDIELELVKINEEWLINGAFWSERR